MRPRTKLFSFLAMSCAFILMTVQLSAWSSAMQSTCTFLNGDQDISCSFSSTGGNWSMSGSYDFSGMEESEALFKAADVCDQVWYAIQDDCYSSDFQEYLYDYHLNEYPEECFITWAGGMSCDQGTTGQFSASCAWINWCVS